MKEPLKGRVRVAGAQYFIRPIERFSQFEDQVSSAVATAADYRCRLVVLPEYFTLQLVSLGDNRQPFSEQVRGVTAYLPQFVDLMSRLAREHDIYIVAGTIPVQGSGDVVYNESYLFSPSGERGVQGKLHVTRFEREDWLVSPSRRLNVFETDFGKMAIAICYDVEFPELVRAAARRGVHLLAVPSNTDDRLGFLRVRYCAHARAIENQMYVIHTSTVGGLPRVPDVSLNYGQASILTPSDFAFARDGILAESAMNQETILVGELDMKTIEESRTFGTVLPLNDSAITKELIAEMEEFVL